MSATTVGVANVKVTDVEKKLNMEFGANNVKKFIAVARGLKLLDDERLIDMYASCFNIAGAFGSGDYEYEIILLLYAMKKKRGEKELEEFLRSLVGFRCPLNVFSEIFVADDNKIGQVRAICVKAVSKQDKKDEEDNYLFLETIYKRILKVSNICSFLKVDDSYLKKRSTFDICGFCLFFLDSDEFDEEKIKTIFELVMEYLPRFPKGTLVSPPIVHLKFLFALHFSKISEYGFKHFLKCYSESLEFFCGKESYIEYLLPRRIDFNVNDYQRVSSKEINNNCKYSLSKFSFRIKVFHKSCFYTRCNSLQDVKKINREMINEKYKNESRVCEFLDHANVENEDEKCFIELLIFLCLCEDFESFSEFMECYEDGFVSCFSLERYKAIKEEKLLYLFGERGVIEMENDYFDYKRFFCECAKKNNLEIDKSCLFFFRSLLDVSVISKLCTIDDFEKFLEFFSKKKHELVQGGFNIILNLFEQQKANNSLSGFPEFLSYYESICGFFSKYRVFLPLEILNRIKMLEKKDLNFLKQIVEQIETMFGLASKITKTEINSFKSLLPNHLLIIEIYSFFNITNNNELEKIYSFLENCNSLIVDFGVEFVKSIISAEKESGVFKICEFFMVYCWYFINANEQRDTFESELETNDFENKHFAAMLKCHEKLINTFNATPELYNNQIFFFLSVFYSIAYYVGANRFAEIIELVSKKKMLIMDGSVIRVLEVIFMLRDREILETESLESIVNENILGYFERFVNSVQKFSNPVTQTENVKFAFLPYIEKSMCATKLREVVKIFVLPEKTKKNLGELKENFLDDIEGKSDEEVKQILDFESEIFAKYVQIIYLTHELSNLEVCHYKGEIEKFFFLVDEYIGKIIDNSLIIVLAFAYNQIVKIEKNEIYEYSLFNSYNFYDFFSIFDKSCKYFLRDHSFISEDTLKEINNIANISIQDIRSDAAFLKICNEINKLNEFAKNIFGDKVAYIEDLPIFLVALELHCFFEINDVTTLKRIFVLLLEWNDLIVTGGIETVFCLAIRLSKHSESSFLNCVLFFYFFENCLPYFVTPEWCMEHECNMCIIFTEEEYSRVSEMQDKPLSTLIQNEDEFLKEIFNKILNGNSGFFATNFFRKFIECETFSVEKLETFAQDRGVNDELVLFGGTYSVLEFIDDFATFITKEKFVDIFCEYLKCCLNNQKQISNVEEKAKEEEAKEEKEEEEEEGKKEKENICEEEHPEYLETEEDEEEFVRNKERMKFGNTRRGLETTDFMSSEELEKKERESATLEPSSWPLVSEYEFLSLAEEELVKFGICLRK